MQDTADQMSDVVLSGNILAVIASVIMVLTSSTFILFLCAICRRYSLDFTDYDRNNTQVIYNVSAGAKELPSEYTLGQYRGYNRDYRRDFVVANPALSGTDNVAYTPNQSHVLANPAVIDMGDSTYTEKHGISAHDSGNSSLDFDDDGLTFQNQAFHNQSP